MQGKVNLHQEEYTMMQNADQVSATKHFCQTCLKPNSRLKCVACRASFYCSDECQNQDWNLHKEHCKSFKGRAPGVSLYDSCAICRESLWDKEGKATESRGTVARLVCHHQVHADCLFGDYAKSPNLMPPSGGARENVACPKCRGSNSMVVSFKSKEALMKHQ